VADTKVVPYNLGQIPFGKKVYTSDQVDYIVKNAGLDVGIYKYRGTVHSYDDLPWPFDSTDSNDSPSVGDVYDVEEGYEDSNYSIPPGTNWAWNGERWDPLSGSLADYLSKKAAAETYATKTELGDKADKVPNATADNFAGLDENGNLKDSGKKAGDFATAEQGAKADSAIQSVKVNGTALTPDAQKAVDIPAATTGVRGVVKLNNYTNSTSVTEAATPNAVKTAMDNANGRASLTEDNEFYGANTFRSVPDVKTTGFTNIMFFRVVYDESLGDDRYDPVFTMDDVSMVYRSSWDSELTREFFHEFFSEACWRLLTDGEWLFAGNLSGASFYDAVDGSTETFEVATGYTDEATGEWVEEQWKTAYIDWSGSRLDLDVNDHGGYGESTGVVVVPMREAGTAVWIGDLRYPLSFGVNDGYTGPKGTVTIEGYSDFQFYDESGSPIDASPTDYEFPGLRASTDPSDPAYDLHYEEYPDEYGWLPALDTRLATMADIPDVEASVAAHNDDTSAHNLLFSGKLNTSHNTDANAHSALFSAAAPLPPIRVGNLMDTGVIRFPWMPSGGVGGVYSVTMRPVDLVLTAGRSILISKHTTTQGIAVLSAAGTYIVNIGLDASSNEYVDVLGAYYPGGVSNAPVRNGFKLVDFYLPVSLSPNESDSDKMRVFQISVATDHSTPGNSGGTYTYTTKTLLSIPRYIPDMPPVTADSVVLNMTLVKIPCVITYSLYRTSSSSNAWRVMNFQANMDSPLWKHVDYSFVHNNASTTVNYSFPSAVYRPEPDWTPVPSSYLGDFFTT